MNDIELKRPKKVGSFSVAAGLANPFEAICALSENNEDLYILSFLGKEFYFANSPEIVQHILQKNHNNYNKDEGYEALEILIGKGLITNDGPDWRKKRTLIQPAFHRKTLSNLVNIVLSSTDKMLARWKGKLGSSINLTEEMASLTIEIVARALFTSDIDSDDIKKIYDHLNHLNFVMSKKSLGKFYFPKFLNSRLSAKTKESIQVLNDIVDGLIERRKASKGEYTDLLQLLLDARYEETGDGMSMQEVRSELMTLFVAGHETTVNALSWTWYLLLQYPEQLSRLREEAYQVMRQGPISFEGMRQLTYSDCVAKEGMRLYPPVCMVGRRALAEDHFDGYVIPKGQNIGVNIAGLHRNSKYWDRPLQFDPDRFRDFELKGLNRFFYLPFGGGPRVCIGNNFAMTEMILINSLLAARVDMELINDPIKPVLAITMKPGDGVMVKLKEMV